MGEGTVVLGGCMGMLCVNGRCSEDCVARKQTTHPLLLSGVLLQPHKIICGQLEKVIWRVKIHTSAGRIANVHALCVKVS